MRSLGRAIFLRVERYDAIPATPPLMLACLLRQTARHPASRYLIAPTDEERWAFSLATHSL